MIFFCRQFLYRSVELKKIISMIYINTASLLWSHPAVKTPILSVSWNYQFGKGLYISLNMQPVSVEEDF